MKLPQKITILDDVTQTLPQMGFGGVDEKDVARQIRYLAIRFNEMVEYLRALPMVPNEIDTTTNKLGVHEHNWVLQFRMKNIGTYTCTDCSEIIKKAIPVNYVA